MSYLFEILCAFLIAMSLIFIFVQVRAKFDRSFLVFGLTNLLICLFCAIDIWVQPNEQLIQWTTIQHLLASFFPPFLVWHIMLMIKKEKLAIIRVFAGIGVLFSVLFATGLMLRPTGKEVITTLLYNITFAPYLVFVMSYLLVLIGFSIKSSQPDEQRMLLFHFFGLVLLCLGGFADMMLVVTGSRLLPSFSVLGTLGFSFAATVIFAEKLSAIVREREITFDKLKAAYRELEEAQALKELGQSSAIVNHEIRNYASVIAGYSELLLKSPTLDSSSERKVRKINDAIGRLVNFSIDILEFSKSKVLKDTVPLNIQFILRSCIDAHFSKSADSFEISGQDDCVINGDSGKLDQVFMNLFKNALEAQAEKITITVSQSESTVLCVVEDDGIGCGAEQLQNLFKSFYTTKKSQGGTGLGMCVVRSIIEAHGGHVTAYTKNNKAGDHGLFLNITFPKYQNDQKGSGYNGNLVLVKESMEDIASVIRIFQNVNIKPQIVQSVSELGFLPERVEMTIFASPACIAEIESERSAKRKVLTLQTSSEGQVMVKGTGDTVPFSEKYLLSMVNQRQMRLPAS